MGEAAASCVKRSCRVRGIYDRQQGLRELDSELEAAEILSSGTPNKSDLRLGEEVQWGSAVITGPVLLVGEPGSGKTTALQVLAEDLGSRALLLGLDEYGTREEFAGQLTRHLSRFQGDERPWLLMDQLDESVRPEGLPRWIAEVVTSFPTPPHIVLAARPGGFPRRLPEVLERVWGTYETWQLLPLGEEQQRAIAETFLSGSELEQFLTWVKINASFTYTPRTLSAAITAYGRGERGRTVEALYHSLLSVLIEEPDAGRAGARGGFDLRMRAAELIAAHTVLSSSHVISLNAQAADEDVCVTWSVLEGEEEIIALGKEELDHLLESGLFTSLGPRRYRIANASLAAFLTASYLARKQLPWAQYQALLAPNPQAPLAPRLAETASWCLALRPDLFSPLLECDPAGLIPYAELFGDDSVLEELTAGALREYENVHYRGGIQVAQLRALWHPQLGSQVTTGLAQALAEKPYNHLLLRLVLDLAWVAKDTSLIPQLLAVAEDEKYPGRIRRQAAEAAFEADAQVAAPRLLQLLQGLSVAWEAAHDHMHFFRGSLLQLLWPGETTLAQVLPHLKFPAQEMVYGPYQRFVQDLPTAVRSEDMPLLLGWAMGQMGGDEAGEELGEELYGETRDRNWIGTLRGDWIDDLVTQALSRLQAEEDLAKVAHIAYPRLREWNQMVWEDFSEQPDSTSRRAARELALHLLREATEDSCSDAGSLDLIREWNVLSPDPGGQSSTSRRGLLGSGDAAWLYEHLALSSLGGQEAFASKLMLLLYMIYEPGSSPELDLRIQTEMGHPAYDLLCDKVRAAEAAAATVSNLPAAPRRKGAAIERADNYVAEIRRTYEVVIAGGHEQAELLWRGVHRYLRNETHRPLTHPRMKALLGDAWTEPLLPALLWYVNAATDIEEPWIHTASISIRAAMAYDALYLISEAGRLDEISSNAWKTWAAAVVWGETYNGMNPNGNTKLVYASAQHAPEELASALQSYIRASVEGVHGSSFPGSLSTNGPPPVSAVWREFVTELGREQAEGSGRV